MLGKKCFNPLISKSNKTPYTYTNKKLLTIYFLSKYDLLSPPEIKRFRHFYILTKYTFNAG